MYKIILRFGRIVLPLLFGVVVVVGSLVMFVQHEYRSIKWDRTVGDVYDVIVYKSEKSLDSYTAFFTYTVDEQEYEGVARSRFTSYHEGETLELFYDPNKPENYTTVSTGSDFTKLIFTVIGAFIIYIHSKMLINLIHQIQDKKSLDTD